MSNIGFLTLSLLDVKGREAADPDTRVEVVRPDGTVIHKFSNLQFPPSQRLQITAFPQASNLHCEVLPKRYRHCKINFFTLNDNEERAHRLQVLRDPKKWQARFLTWNQLPGHFEPLKAVLSASTIKVVKGESLGQFIEGKYDQVNAKETVLAKAAMLNLFAKLTMVPEPIGGWNPWFNFIKQILMIDRERLFAIVDKEMGEIVRHVCKDINRFDHYQRIEACTHFRKLQDDLPGYRIFKSKMISVKTDERHANLQLTLAPAKDPQGQDVLLLDADIDENGDLLNHLIDVALIHPVSGGTHPFDIHEYLLREDRNLQLGYELA